MLRLIFCLSFLFHGVSTALAGQAAIESINQSIQSNPDYLDFTLQDVCVDTADNVIAGDPVSCTLKRNIRIGEKVPYIVTDYNTATSTTYQALSSYPVVGPDNQLKILTTKTNKWNPGSAFTFDFVEARDGYDLLAASGGYVTGIRTSDGGCLDQKISATAYQRYGGWIFFPYVLGTSNVVHSIYLERLSPHRPTHCGALGVAHNVLAVWNTPTAITYETGKVINSIVSYHFAQNDFTAPRNSMERFFFTREYGFTRWEAWLTVPECALTYPTDPARCNPATLNPRCGATYPLPGTATWGTQNWVRVDCRDSTRYQAVTTPFIPLTSEIGTKNSLTDINVSAVFDAQALGTWNGNGAGSSHVAGAANGLGWETPANNVTSLVTYGPYVLGLPAIPLKAMFTLKIDNVLPANEIVGWLDVYNSTTDTILASRYLYKSDFLANKLKDHSLAFNYGGTGKLEFRVGTTGKAKFFHARTRVLKQ